MLKRVFLDLDTLKKAIYFDKDGMTSLPATPIGALKEFAKQKYSNFSNQHPQDFLRSKRLLNVSCTFSLLPVSQWVSMFWRNQ